MMTWLRSSVPGLLAGLLAGLGVWCTAARLDFAPSEDGLAGLTRVATLPPVWLLALTIVGGAGLVALAGLAIPRLVSRVSDLRMRAEAVRAACWPLAATSLIAVPYLPWLPDALPVVTVLAGPGCWLLWGVAVAETVRGLVRAAEPVSPRRTARDATAGHASDAPDRSERRERGAPLWGPRWVPRWSPVVLLIVGLLVSGTAAWKLTATPLFPGGDEPHYLIMAQSLWRDGDLKIANNHRQGDYREYYLGRDLEPHTLGHGTDGEIYSVHPVGLPVLLAPIYALAGYRGAVLAMLVMASAAAGLMTVWVARVTGDRGGGIVAWAALFLSTPFLYNAMAIYPEVPAALLVMAVFVASWPGISTVPRALACGLAIAALPWLSTKYALMAGALGLVALGRLLVPLARDPRPGVRLPARVLALVLPCLASLGGWLLFFKVIWGRWSPAAPYGTQRETRLAYLPEGGPGLLFDQEYGIVAFAPILFLGVTGLVSLIREGGQCRRLGLEVAGVFGALLGLVGAFHLWWGGTAPVGRPLIAGLLLLALPIAWQYRRAATRPALHAAYRQLLWIGLAVTATMGLAQQGLLLVANRDGASRLLDYLSPGWPLTALAPTYLRSSVAEAWTVTACWVVVALAAAWLLAQVGRGRVRAHLGPLGRHPGALSLLATGGALVALSLLVPIVTGHPVAHSAKADGRASVSLLESFDRVARPWAVRYDRLQIIDPGAAPPLFPLVAYPARPEEEDPLLFGRRLSLPAGRYEVELQGTAGQPPRVEGELALQIGRLGQPLVAWDVRLDRQGSWAAPFELPIDVNYLGFRASAPLTELAPRVQVRPRAITDARHRLPRLGVASARTYGATQVITHDHRAWLEREGLWVQGAATVPLTISRSGARGVLLTLRAGPTRTTVDLVTGTRREQHTLTADARVVVAVRLDARGVGRVWVTTSDGFVPATTFRRSQDQRFLGCWIEIG